MLTEEVQQYRAIKETRLKAELAQAKREKDFYLQQVCGVPLGLGTFYLGGEEVHFRIACWALLFSGCPALGTDVVCRPFRMSTSTLINAEVLDNLDRL